MDTVSSTSSSAVKADEGGLDEMTALLGWHFGHLARGGFALEDAILIACHPEIDLHGALDLVRHGCPSATAVEILL